MSTIPQSNNGKHPPPSSFPPSSFNSIRNAFLPPLTSVSQHSNTLTPLNHPQQSQHQHRPQFPQQTLPHPQAHHPPNHHFPHQSQQNISYLTAEHQQYVPNSHNPAQQHPQHFPQPRPNAYQLYQRPTYIAQNQLPHSNFANSPQRMPQLPQPNFPKLKSTITQSQAKNNNTPPVQHPNHQNQGQVFIHQSGQPQQVIHQHQPNQQHFPNNLRSFNLNNIPPNNSNDLRQLKNVQILNQQQRLQQTQAHTQAQAQPTPPQPPTQQQQQTPQQQPQQHQQQSQALPQHHNQYQNQNHHNQNFQPQIPQNQHIQQHQQQHQQHQQHQAQNAQEPPKKRAATGMQPWNNQSAPQNSQNNSSSMSANSTPASARPMSSAGQPRTSILHPMNAVLSNPGLSNQFQHQHQHQQNMHMSAYDYEGFPYQVMPQGEHMNSQQYQNIPYSNGSSQHGDGNMVNRNLKVSNIQSQNLKPISSPQFFKMQVSKSQNGASPANQASVHNNGLKRDLSPHSIPIPKPLVSVPAPAPTPVISQPKSADPPKPQAPMYFPIHSTAPTPVSNASTHIIKNSEVKIAPAPISQNSEPTYNSLAIPTKPQVSPNQEPAAKPKFEPPPEPEPEPKPKIEEDPEPQQPEQKVIKPNSSERKSTSRPPTKVPNFPGRVPSHLLVTNEQRMQILNIETPKYTFGAGDQDKAKEYLHEHKLSKEFMTNPLNKWKTRNTRRRKSIVTHLYQCCCGSDVRNFHGTKGVRKSKQKYPFVGCLAFVEVARKVDDDTILWVRGIMNHDEKCVAAMPNPQV